MLFRMISWCLQENQAFNLTILTCEKAATCFFCQSIEGA